MPVPDDLGFVGRIFVQCGDRLLSTTFLRDTDNSVQDKDCENLKEGSISTFLPLESKGARLTTAGSTNAVNPSPSSMIARANETPADASNIITN